MFSPHCAVFRHGRNTVYDIYGDVSVEEFPKFQQASWVECRQEAGQILFVPSGWYHQVTNLVCPYFLLNYPI